MTSSTCKNGTNDKTITISYEHLENVKIDAGCRSEDKEFNGMPGKEHYKLLAYLSFQFSNEIIFDIGTHVGSSALALSQNPKNKIFTFDIFDKLSKEEKKSLWRNDNVFFFEDDLFDLSIFSQWKETILKSKIILLDIDPHEGTREYKFYTWLKRNNYKGILILDDIYYFKEMRDNLWYKIPSCEKMDATELGHWSGTGIVTFDSCVFHIKIYPKIPYKIHPTSSSSSSLSWTIVTAYFNLTKRPDASNEIKARNLSYYMKHANMTMSLEQNLIIYCDAESESCLRDLRPPHLLSKTKFVIIEFEDINVVKNYYEKILLNRKEKNYSGAADPRNTVSYYLFCMSRYELIMKTISENPFGSTHFAWCNICIERMNWKNDIVFPRIWREFRDKFSTCYIDYQPRCLVIEKPEEYYRYGGKCSMCSGFFTGNKEYMGEFCKEIMIAFKEMCDLKLGHADEQLFSIVYFKKPELFEFYYGDYTEMIVNYDWIRDRQSEPIRNIMRNLLETKENWGLLYDVTSRWISSYFFNTFSNNEYNKKDLEKVLDYNLKSITFS